ncbi:MAG: glycosyl hydrolase 2 galactose-binding domain-containing protein [Zwartia sp.]
MRPKKTQGQDIDPFAAIGQGRMDQVEQKPGMVEQLPPELPDKELRAGKFDPAHDFSLIPRGEKSFKKDIAALRGKYAAFLSKKAPALDSPRKRQILAQAQWRVATAKDLHNPGSAMRGHGKWNNVRIPHYGPPVGRATTYYRFEVNLSEAMFSRGRIVACFKGADYKAQIYFNGSFVREHEGFFASFEADVTHLAKRGKNFLFVRLDNDGICNGDGEKGGDKIYAATGLGWDDPQEGWHHCPPGMGLYQDVSIESRESAHIHDAWVRPLPDRNEAEVRINIFNSSTTPISPRFELAIHGRNFVKRAKKCIAITGASTGAGLSEYRVSVPMEFFRWWSPETPWLYEVQVRLFDGKGKLLDTSVTPFGMRTFEIVEAGAEKGNLLFNGKSIRLRGANTMGHEQQCVFKGDREQLLDDILIAKLGNLNFLRITQRPVQAEIYEACDALGMLVQTDLPLFTDLRRPQYAEAVRQSGAMERLIRSHPSCFLVSLINEPFPLAWVDSSHRNLLRDELESFFRAAGEIIRYENPDRQIKAVDGDYNPPGPGLPDNHCYCGWYLNIIDLGKLHRGYWVGVKEGWHYACGEFGAEGLDHVGLMKRHYPKSWLPTKKNEKDWTPSSIVKSQWGAMYPLWIDRADSLEEWVEASHEHQSWVTRLMTRAFRRDRRMVSFAIHLLIDAFPAGWMKAIVDCERNPKPAYFDYKEALRPLLVDARMDRWGWWSGEKFSAEAWVCHDGVNPMPGIRLRHVIEINGAPVFSGETDAWVPACDSAFQGHIRTVLPEVQERSRGQLKLSLVDSKEKVLSTTVENFSLFPPQCPLFDKSAIRILRGDEKAATFVAEVGLTTTENEATHIVLGDAKRIDEVLPAVNDGATLVILDQPPGKLLIGDDRIEVQGAGFGPRHFVSRATGHPLVRGFEKNDFRFWYSPKSGCVAPLMTNLFLGIGWIPILTTGQAGWGVNGMHASYACGERPFGKGKIILCQLASGDGFVLANPTAREFSIRLLTGMSAEGGKPTKLTAANPGK